MLTAQLCSAVSSGALHDGKNHTTPVSELGAMLQRRPDTDRAIDGAPLHWVPPGLPRWGKFAHEGGPVVFGLCLRKFFDPGRGCVTQLPHRHLLAALMDQAESTGTRFGVLPPAGRSPWHGAVRHGSVPLPGDGCQLGPSAPVGRGRMRKVPGMGRS